jgi:hypothetical protein
VQVAGEDPRSTIGIEDGPEPADALSGVPAAHRVEADVDGFAPVALAF